MVAVLLEASPLAHRAFGLRTADDPDHIFPVAHGPIPRTQKTRPLHLPYLALRLTYRSHCLHHAGLPPLMTIEPDTRKLLRTGLLIFGTGVVATALVFISFGCVTHQG